MLIYLPTGRLVAFSKSIKFERLGRVSSFEGRARVLLICFRYLIDFFSPQMIGMQFQDSFELSGSLLRFYEPAGGKDVYLQNILSWNKYRGFRRLLNWLAVIIEKESQRDELDELLLPADAILKAGDSVPESIDYCIPLSHTEHLREPAILMLKRAIKKSKRSPSHSMFIPIMTIVTLMITWKACTRYLNQNRAACTCIALTTPGLRWQYPLQPCGSWEVPRYSRMMSSIKLRLTRSRICQRSCISTKHFF